MIWLELAAGLVVLLGGGEAVVKGSVCAASRLGVSPLLIGLTVVGFGTSLPELVASLEAALIGAPGIALGNVVGSNIANILLILGISAVILPLATTRDAFRRDGTVLVSTSLLLLLVVLSGSLRPWIGVVFLLLLGAYTSYAYFDERRSRGAAANSGGSEPVEVAPRNMSLRVGLLLVAGGIAGVVLGATLLVSSAVAIADSLGVSETVIGLTVVAVGTSLPELAVSIMAVFRRQGDVAFGNVVGSNIFNILGIMGVTAMVAPIAVPSQIIRFDIWVMLATVVLLVVFAVTGWRVSRVEGAVLLAAYAAYLVAQFSPAVRLYLG